MNVIETEPRDRRALNAYRHGLTGQIVILTPEDQVAYEEHCAGILKSLAPEGAMETSLAQSIADDRWRLLRAAAIDNSRFAIGLSRPVPDNGNNLQVDDAFSQAVTWARDSRNLNLLSLYEGRAQRRVERNMVMLQQLQAMRQAALQKIVEEATLLAEYAESQGKSFDVERDIPRESFPPQFDFSGPVLQRLTRYCRRLADAKKYVQPVQKSARKPLTRAA